MRILCLCILLLAISCKQQDQSSASAKVTKSSIINGVYTTKTEEAGLYNAGVAFLAGDAYCSGVLIAKNVVLTAAHCIVDGGPAYVFLGGLAPHPEFQEDYPENNYEVKKIIINDKFAPDERKSSKKGDLAILILKEDARAPFSPVKIYDAFDFVKKALPVYTAGFSLYSDALRSDVFDLFNGQINTVYKKSNVDDNADVPMLFRNTIMLEQRDEDTDAFYYTQLAGGACSGDSGGPTLMKLDNEYFLIGINRAIVNKTENGLSDCEYFSTATSVALNKKWIKDTIAKESKNKAKFVLSKGKIDAKELACAKAVNFSFELYLNLYEPSSEFCKTTASTDLNAQLSQLNATCEASCSGLKGFKGQCEFFSKGSEKIIAHHLETCKK